MSDIFSADPVEIDLTFNDVVGEDKKYKDPDALAKAYANIERHARTLEAENARVRAELDAKQATNNNSGSSETPRQEPPAEGDNPPPAPNPTPKQDVDLRSQIQNEIKAVTQQERARQNIDAAAQKMVDLYGSPAAANEAVRKRAQELGTTVERLQESAAESPSLFFATMGTPSGGTDRSTPAPSSDYVDRGGQGNQKDFEFFDKIRKDNPKLYYSAATQAEMMKSARELGASFYKR